MPACRFHYFDVRARGEMVRMALAAAEIDFEDVRCTFDNWKDFKPKTPSGKLPMLEIDGETLFESQAMIRHIARLKGLYGESEMEKTMVDTVLDVCEEVAFRIRSSFFEKDEAKVAEHKKIINDKMLQKIPVLDMILTENQGGKAWIVGSKLTIADVVMHTTFEGYEDVLKSQSKALWEHRQRVEGVEGIKKYLMGRPSRPM